MNPLYFELKFTLFLKKFFINEDEHVLFLKF